MEWLNLHVGQHLRAPEFLKADPCAQGTWLMLMAYCTTQENGGVISGAREWGDRMWFRSVGCSLSEIDKPSDLWVFVGSDLHVWGYQNETQARITQARIMAGKSGRIVSDAKTRAARQNGRSGGRPKHNPSENPTETQQKPNDNPTNPTKGEGEGEGEGKGKEETHTARVRESEQPIPPGDLRDVEPTPERPSGFPSTEDEAAAWCDTVGVPGDVARRLWNELEGTGWRDKSGRLVTSFHRWAKGVYEAVRANKAERDARAAGPKREGDWEFKPARKLI